MKDLLALGFVLLAAPLVVAQAPATKSEGAQALELAARLGRERSAEGLETILRGGNMDLVSAYVSGSGQVGDKPVPPEVQALILQYYDDPRMGARLIILCSTNGGRCTSHALFDRMLAELRSGKARVGYTNELGYAVSRFGGKEEDAALLAWLQAPDAPTGAVRSAIVQGFGNHKYEPAVPVIAANLAKLPPQQAYDDVFALSQIDTPQAIEAMLAHLAVLKRAPQSPEVRKQEIGIGNLLMRIPPARAPSYERLRAVLPDDVRDFAIVYLNRKDLKAVPDGLVLLGDKAQAQAAYNSLTLMESPEIWKQTLVEIERLNKEGRIEPALYARAKYALDTLLTDPGKHFAEKQVEKDSQAFSAKHQALEQKKVETQKLLASNPERYVTEMREHVTAVEKLIAENPTQGSVTYVKGRLALDNLEMGHVVRFKLKQPQEALKHYADAQRNGSLLGAYATADTWQFDLREPKRALAEYRKLVTPMPPKAPPGMSFPTLTRDAWAQRWLAAQIAYLESGKTFSGEMIEEDLWVGEMLVQQGGSSDVFGLAPLQRKVFQSDPRTVTIDRKEMEQALLALPPSGLALLQSVWVMSYLPDARAVLAHLQRQDPAGFASASYFTLLEYLENDRGGRAVMMLAPGTITDARPLNEAKSRFLREHRIDMKAIKALSGKQGEGRVR